MEGPDFTFFLGRRLLAWSHFLQHLTVQGWQEGITIVADHLVTVVLLGKLVEGGLDDAALKEENQVQGGLFLDIVESAATPPMQDRANFPRVALYRKRKGS